MKNGIEIIEDLDGLEENLIKLIDQGVKEVVIPAFFLKRINGFVSNVGWGAKEAMLHVKGFRDKKIFVHVAQYKMTPADYREGILQIRELEPEFKTLTQLNNDFFIKAAGKKPKFQVNDYLKEEWKQKNILHLTQWGLSWDERDQIKDQLDQYDKNKAHLGSISTAHFAPLYNEDFLHFGKEAPVSKKMSGMYKIVVPAWDHILPNPWSFFEEGTEGWVSSDIVNFYLNEIDFTKTKPLIIKEAFLAPVHSMKGMRNLYDFYCYGIRNYSDKEAYKFFKAGYQKFAGNLSSDRYSAKRYNRIFRPDWAQNIRDTTWANNLRIIYKQWKEDKRYVPVAINTDAIYYPKGLETPSTFKIGNEIGQMKKVGD